MAAIKYKVELTEAEWLRIKGSFCPKQRLAEEVSRLNEVSQRGKASVRTVKQALSLLKLTRGFGTVR